jgi:hypothetical protein
VYGAPKYGCVTELRQLEFDQDLIERFRDFQEAYLNADQQTILAEAARAFIDIYSGCQQSRYSQAMGGGPGAPG